MNPQISLNKLKVVIGGQQHLSTANMPRHSQHHLIRPKSFPVGRYPIANLWYPLGSFMPWQPLWGGYEIIHSFNRIIYTNKPWFITFEDHRFLYREPQNKAEKLFFNFLNNRLSLENCQKIIAISDYAKVRFLNHIEEWDKNVIINKKLEIIHPNFLVKVKAHKTYKNKQNLQLIFVGNHIARKGGIIALRLAQKAEKLGLPITIHIVSELWRGKGVPTDFPDGNRYLEDLKLLDLNNVVFHKQISNNLVLELLSESDFQFMPTLMDTYGYSIVEGFSVATPAITTNVCALPEIVQHDVNGYVLELPLNELRHWSNWLHGDQTNTEEYWEILNSTYNDLAARSLQQISQFLDRTDKNEHYELLSAGALMHIENVNNAEKQNQLFDRLYATAAGLY